MVFYVVLFNTGECLNCRPSTQFHRLLLCEVQAPGHHLSIATWLIEASSYRQASRLAFNYFDGVDALCYHSVTDIYLGLKCNHYLLNNLYVTKQ